MNGKKGVSEPATDIAALILLILLSIVIYVVLLPPAEREILLSEDNETAFNNGNGIASAETLLSVSPGALHSSTKDTIKKQLTPISLFTRTDRAKINLASSLLISKTPFSEESRQLSFRLDNLNNLDSSNLYFLVKDANGEISIELNGNIIFEGALDSSRLPIELPVSSLQSSNILKFSVKSRWWDSYDITDIYITTDYSYENTKARRTFEITSKEKSTVEKAKLEYYVNCLSRDRSILSILLNSKVLSDDYIVCDAGKRTLEISPRDFIVGTNSLEFTTAAGMYDLQSLELNLNIGERDFPEYNFEITNEVYKQVFNSCFIDCESDCGYDCRGNNACYSSCLSDCEIKCGRANIVLEIIFGGSNDKKSAAITINEFQINVNSRAPEYTRVISDYITRGDNVIKIVPKSSFEIINMRVFVG